jgi:hypothetical protein
MVDTEGTIAPKDNLREENLMNSIQSSGGQGSRMIDLMLPRSGPANRGTLRLTKGHTLNLARDAFILWCGCKPITSIDEFRGILSTFIIFTDF